MPDSSRNFRDRFQASGNAHSDVDFCHTEPDLPEVRDLEYPFPVHASVSSVRRAAPALSGARKKIPCGGVANQQRNGFSRGCRAIDRCNCDRPKERGENLRGFRGKVVGAAMLHIVILKHGRSCRRQGLNEHSVELRLQPESFRLDIVFMRQSDLRPAHDIPLFLRRTAPPTCRTAGASIVMRHGVPDAELDLALCCNAVLSYIAPPLQRQVMAQAISRVHPRGALVIGIGASSPDGLSETTGWPGAGAIFGELEVGALPSAAAKHPLVAAAKSARCLSGLHRARRTRAAGLD